MDRDSNPIFKKRTYKLEEDLGSGSSEYFHRLANSGERGIIKRRGRHVVKTHDGAICRHSLANLREGPDRTERGEVVESQECRELSLATEKFPGGNETCLVARTWQFQLHRELRIYT
jgi:hypothetical protein